MLVPEDHGLYWLACHEGKETNVAYRAKAPFNSNKFDSSFYTWVNLSLEREVLATVMDTDALPGKAYSFVCEPDEFDAALVMFRNISAVRPVLPEFAFSLSQFLNFAEDYSVPLPRWLPDQSRNIGDTDLALKLLHARGNIPRRDGRYIVRGNEHYLPLQTDDIEEAMLAGIRQGSTIIDLDASYLFKDG